MRKAFILAAVLENYIPENVHISFPITNKGRKYFAKTQKAFSFSMVNSGK